MTLKNYPAKVLSWGSLCKNVVPFFIVLLLFWPMAARAQMFSADHSPQEFSLPRTAIYAGIEPMDFSYQGNEGGGSMSSTDLFSFKGDLVRLRFETPGVHLSAGFGGDATGLGNISYFDAGIRIGSGIQVFRSKSFFFQIPIQLHSSYTSVNNNKIQSFTAPGFQEGTFEGALGAALHVKIASRFRIQASVLPSYGFAFSTRERDASGSVAEVEGQLRLFFDHLFGNAGLSLGYDYSFRQFNISGESLDYQSTGNSFLIGITF